MERICKLLVDRMALFVLAAAVLGAAVPGALAWVGPNIPFLLGLVMFGMGMTLSVEDFRVVLQRPSCVFIGVLAQFLIMPFVAWALTMIFGLPPELAIGVILVGTCPGGTASNVIAYLAKGDVALSVSMTMTTTLLAPVVTPALTYFLAGSWIDISLTAMMISIAKMVLAPVLLGLLVNHFLPGLVKKLMPVLPVISMFSVVLIAGGVVALSAEKIFSVGVMLAVIVVLHNVFGLLLGYGLAHLLRMEEKQARTVSIEVGMQNSGLAVSLAMLYFTPAAAISGVIFSVWHNLSGSLVANYFRSREVKNG